MSLDHARADRDPRFSAHGDAPHALLQPVLARARHRLDRRVHYRISRSIPMSDSEDAASEGQQTNRDRFRSYATGLVLAVILTAASFAAASSNAVWGPSVPVLLAVLAIAQMGV